MRTATPYHRNTILISVLFFFCGCFFGFHYGSLNNAPGETGAIAINVLEKGYMGSPYLIDTGPSAHGSPLLTYMLAAVYFVFGENSPGARQALSVIAAAEYGLSVYVCLSLVRVLGKQSTIAFWLALVLILTTGGYLFSSVVYFRQWDQPTAALMLVLGWLTQAVAEERQSTSISFSIAMALLAGVGMVLSPALMPSLCWGLLVVISLRKKFIPMLRGVGLAALIVAVAVVPWGMRNYHVFGHFIFTRSNFGLELAAGNADDSNGFSGTGAGWILHPHDNLPAAERLAKVGEIEYMKEMKEIAISWISSHPLTFLVLTVKRFGLCMTVGPAWLPTIGASATAFVYLIFGALKTISLSVSLVLRYRPLSALMYCVAPLAPYVITHVNERYPFVVLFTSIALISITATQLLTRVAPHLEFPSVVPR